MTKIIKWIILGVVVLLLAGWLTFYFTINRIIRSVVQDQTQKQLKVDTKLSSANFSLFGGSLSLSDFALGSPKGFTAPQMFQMNKASVDVSYGQLRSDPVRIRDITINKPVLIIEQANGQVNYKALMDQLPPPQQTEKPMHLVINKLSITDPTVLLRPGLPGLAEQISIPLQGITLENVGTGPGAENGAALQQVVMEVVMAMANQAAHSDKLPDQLKQLLALNPDEVVQKIGGEVGKQLGKVQQDLQKQLGAPATQAIGDVLNQTTGQPDPGKAVEKGLQDLLKQPKDDKKK